MQFLDYTKTRNYRAFLKYTTILKSFVSKFLLNDENSSARCECVRDSTMVAMCKRNVNLHTQYWNNEIPIRVLRFQKTRVIHHTIHSLQPITCVAIFQDMYANITIQDLWNYNIMFWNVTLNLGNKLPTHLMESSQEVFYSAHNDIDNIRLFLRLIYEIQISPKQKVEPCSNMIRPW